ncbi:MAG: MBL fold metallo-hydrolase [Blastocatellia bacterium]|nr:MBL fold metallo-hydrolase [Blastocatellia bacterium]
MNIIFLGGGNEIGASSAIVEIGANRVLIDCGLRMTGDHRLPDLGAISGSKYSHLDAVLLTHAHMDHSGALPVLNQHYPAVPVYSTAATRGLVEVLLRDSLNIMRIKAESERELPIYTPAAVNELIERMIPVPFGSPMPIGNLAATWFPAGHILGAASVGIEGVENGRTIKVLFSGDIGVSDQLTVPGMLAPADFRPDVLVIESTYGDRLHSPRALEEQRLLEMVAGIVGGGGKLLIPAFAIGRAQEVVLMLLKQFRAKRLQSFPVYIDGMVKTVCGVYSSFPAHQTPFARRLIEQHGNPFFNVVDEIRPVATPDEREKVLSGPPCAIIASSGMLTGGASAFYAQSIVGEERNGIAITGYQDEESPGRQLLALADQETREVTVAGRTLEVKCNVAKYALSAHADSQEITGLIEAINPREIVLVHGEGDARPALRDLLRKQGTRYRPVHLPRTGDTLTFGAVRRSRHASDQPAPPLAGLSGGERLTAEGLKVLAERLREKGEGRRLFSEVDLLDLWYGAQAWDEEHYTELVRLLDDSDDFRRPARGAHLYRLGRVEAEEGPATMFFAEPNEILARTDRLLGPETGLYRKGYDLASHELRLSFEFPLVARERYRAECEEIIEGTGWSYTINESPHHGRLAEVALECLPEGVRATRPPAIHLAQREVVLAVGVSVDEETIRERAVAFEERTGYRLRVDAPNMVAKSAGRDELDPQSASRLFIGEGEREPLEINAAYHAIQEGFSRAPEICRPSRMGLKEDGAGKLIELAFITPQVGERQGETLRAMAELTGWRLRIKPEPNLSALIEAARSLIPDEWALQKQPGIHKEQNLVRARCASPPASDDPALAEVCKRFEEMTGYRLEVVG